MMRKFKTKELISELVPHKGKMLLLDRIRDYDLDVFSITTEIDISRDNLFFQEELGGVPAWVAFEYMAQSISALFGIYEQGKIEKPRIGFVVSVKDFKAETPVFKTGETVVVHVHEKFRMDAAVTFEGFATINGRVMITANISTMEKEK